MISVDPLLKNTLIKANRKLIGMSSFASIWIDHNQLLVEYCNDWQSLSIIGIDTEFIAVNTFYPQPCVIQVSTEDTVYLIDVFAINQWRPFTEILLNPNIIKVLHACQADLDIFKIVTGVIPISIYDTQLAAAYANLGYHLSYQTLTKKLLNINIDKSQTLSDWRQRPLTAKQMQYLVTDTIFLITIYKKLNENLQEKITNQWFKEDCYRLDATLYKEQDKNGWMHLKGAWQLTPNQLIILKSLFNYRESRARKHNLSRNKILTVKEMLTIAVRQPICKNDFILLKLERCATEVLHKPLLEVLYQAQSEKTDNLPCIPQPLFSKRATQYMQCIKNFCAIYAQKYDIAKELTLSSKQRKCILHSKNDHDKKFVMPDAIQGWRRALLVKPLIVTLNKIYK